MVPVTVSIITPAYNAGLFIAESIQSVLAQTYADWELIIVDDESTDNTAKIVKDFVDRDARISYFWQRNGKQGRSRNFGLQQAKGFYVAFMDADDVWMPDKLTKQLLMMSSHSVDLVFGFAYYIKNGMKTTETTGRGSGFYRGDKAVHLHLHQNAFVISTVLMKHSVIKEINFFSEDLRFQNCEDWHFWLKAALSNYSMYSNGETLAYYRVHTNSASQTERQSNIKYFYAFLDLVGKYPKDISMMQELNRIAIGLIFHENSLPDKVVKDVLLHITVKNRFNFFIFSSLTYLNYNLFRKLFVFFYKKRL